MERLTILVTHEQAEWLRREAKREDRPVTYVVRECIDGRREQEQEAA